MRRHVPRGMVIGVVAVMAASLMPPAHTAAAGPLTGKLAWMHYDQAQGDTDIWVMNADGSDQHALTTNAIADGYPAWSPDGSRIAFTSTRAGNQTDVYVMDEDGTNIVRLTEGMGEFALGDWSPVTNELVGTLDAVDPDTFESLGRFLVLIDADTGDVTQLAAYDDGYSPGSFSPDGSQILMTVFRTEEPEIGGVDVWSIDHSGARTRITDTPSPLDEMNPVWSPNGASIAFFTEGDVYAMNADGTGPVQLTSDPDYDESPTWSPDSASIAFNTGRAGDGEKWVMNADGSEQRPLISKFGGEGPADWTDGVIAPLPAPESISEPVADGGSVTTADGQPPDVANPTDTTVTSPFGGTVTITESNEFSQSAPGEFTFIGQQITIDAVTDPATTAANPLQLTFVLDASLIPERLTDAMEAQVFRDGILVEPCAPGADPATTPDPCVLNAYWAGDYDDLTIAVLTSSASDWNIGLAPPTEPPPPPLPESVAAELQPGDSLTTDTEGDGVTPDDVLETTVTTSPEGVAGTVTISEQTNIGLAGPDFTFLGLQAAIQAPDGSALSPILVEFLIHSSQVSNIPVEELRVFRHGVPIEPCAAAGPAADPEPCVASSELVVGDVRIVVRTALVSDLTWTFGYNVPPQPFFVVQSTALTSVDHVVLMLSDEIDPASIPSPSDFEVEVDGVGVTESGVRLLYQGLRGWPLLADVGILDGVALLKVSWDTPVSNFNEITLGYTPGARPLQDRSGNQTPSFADATTEFTSADIELGFIDDGAGANRVVLITGPLDPDLPAPSDFAVTLDGGDQVLTPTAVTLRHQDLGFGVLDLTLPQDIMPWQTATLTYTPGATPLQRLDGRPILTFPLEVFVNVSGTVAGETPASEAGEPVSVTVFDYLGNGATTLDVTFPSVQEGGVTTFQSVGPADVPPLGSNFSAGEPPAFYEIDTTATFTPPAEVCLTYDEGAFADESQVLLLHYEDPAWVDATTSLDLDSNRVCGTVTSFSPFAVVEESAGFDFTGFFSPVDNLPVVNTVSAGRAIPVKFGLGGDHGMEIFEAGSPSSIRVACPLAPDLDTIEATVPTAANSLSYDAATDRYTYVWKTAKAWAGTCRELHIEFSDGTTREVALFKFGK